MAKIKNGRIVIAKSAVLSSLHVVETNGNYDGIKVALMGGAELPQISRDDVSMNDGDSKLVLEVQTVSSPTAVDNSPEYIWISQNGSDVETAVANSGTTLSEQTIIPAASQSDAAKKAAEEATESLTPAEVEEKETVATRYAGGKGTETNPLLLSRKEHFASMDEDYRNGLTTGIYFKLAADLDLGKIYPIGSLSLTGSNGTSSQGYTVINGTAFEGNLDGNNHKLSYEMTADEGLGNSSTLGLFGAVKNCTIKDITINATVLSERASIWVGGVAGFVQGNSSFENVVMNGSIIAAWDVGGFAGAIDDYGVGHFTNCINNASVTTNNKRTGTNYAIAGGFIGQGTFLDNGTVTFANCVNNGVITVGKANTANLSPAASHFVGFASDNYYGTYVFNNCSVGNTAQVVSTIGYTRTINNKTVYCAYTQAAEALVPSIKYVGITSNTWNGGTTNLNAVIKVNGVTQDTSLYVHAN